jgi:peroxiredoxin
MDLTGKNLPNLLVHFAGDNTFNRLASLTQALQQSKRQDTATAVLAVLTPAQLSKAPYTEGIIYGDDQNGAWGRAFGVKSAQSPATLIVSPKGQILWQQNGDIDPTALAASLQKFLVAGATLQLDVFRTNLRIGRPSPNFVFEFAPGRELTLRKLTGSDVALVFWRSSSQPSIDAVLDLLKAAKGGAAQGPVILAINDGEPADLAANIAAANGFSAALVPDPKREISATYGLRIWPTTVYLDSLGLVRAIQHGYSAVQRSKS